VFEEVCANPIGRQLVRELMVLLNASCFGNVKIDFYCGADDVSHLGPRDDPSDNNPRVGYWKSMCNCITKKFEGRGFPSIAHWDSYSVGSYMRNEFDKLKWTGQMIVQFSENPELPIDKFAIILGPDRLLVPGLESIVGEYKWLCVRPKWIFLDQILFHELNHVREILMQIYQSLVRTSVGNYELGSYEKVMAEVAEIIFSKDSDEVDAALKEEAKRYMEQRTQHGFGYRLLKKLGGNIKSFFNPFGYFDPSFSKCFSERDEELHCITGFMFADWNADGEIVWDPINEINYTAKKAEREKKEFFPRINHSSWDINALSLTPEEWKGNVLRRVFFVRPRRADSLCVMWWFLSQILPDYTAFCRSSRVTRACSRSFWNTA
jgi:hypothetical protein